MAAKSPKKTGGKGKVIRKPSGKAKAGSSPAPRTTASASAGASAKRPMRTSAKSAATPGRHAAKPPPRKVVPPPRKKSPQKAQTITSTSSRTAPTKPQSSSQPVKKTKTIARTPAQPRTSSADSPFKNFTPYDPRKGEAYMSTDQLDHFRNILLRWRQELMEEVDRTMHHMQDEAANFPDPADRASQEEEFSIELRTRDRERKLIKKIDQTIDRIDQEDYGYCDTCGVEIGLRRLEARPTASQCVDCKTLDEIKERQQLG
jgi:DnaK suppressor protein